ncbi:hypothetical protein P6144_15155 [Sphingomonas sp. HITSZ_GF]|uniref:hypothetical protein n=1 Tax=Sphingomonas sp. HITSZ_GF TaxID=3037247 RepID=UPI00240D949F|nr:hypothetical protein [Sphingomonas sp. HITSZ_GF]MDG2534996.1 hypothetical protein [Sphingomonas sp. HITSZ_GF]
MNLKKDLPFKLVVGALALVLAWSLLLSDRYWFLTDRPVVDELAAVKVPPELGDMISAIDDYGVHIQRQPSKVELYIAIKRSQLGLEQPVPSYAHMSDPKLGYSVREMTFLGMPFWYAPEYGHVLFFSSDWGVVAAPLNDRGHAALNKANGRDLRATSMVPWWQHLWGWLFLAGLALAIWLWHRRVVRWREENGII